MMAGRRRFQPARQQFDDLTPRIGVDFAGTCANLPHLQRSGRGGRNASRGFTTTLIRQYRPLIAVAPNRVGQRSPVGGGVRIVERATTREIGYLVMDVNRELSDEVHARIAALPMSVRTRILY